MNNMMKRNSNGNAATAGRATTPFSGWVDGVLQNTLNRFLDDNYWGFDGNLANRQIPVNVKETEKTYELEVIAPGLRKEEFRVNISDDLLTVAFEHSQENNEENKQDGYLRKEYRMQSFSRSFELGDMIKADEVSAQYRDGVLYVTLPKKEEAQKLNKTIQIQ
jgi:HSP20 family protein